MKEGKSKTWGFPGGCLAKSCDSLQTDKVASLAWTKEESEAKQSSVQGDKDCKRNKWHFRLDWTGGENAQKGGIGTNFKNEALFDYWSMQKILGKSFWGVHTSSNICTRTTSPFLMGELFHLSFSKCGPQMVPRTIEDNGAGFNRQKRLPAGNLH